LRETAKTIHVGPKTLLGPLLEKAAKSPVILERDGALFRLESWNAEADASTYDPAAVIAVLDSMAGTISEAEANEQIRNLYAAREAGSRPASRP
jgi:hypothetical protein